MATRRRLDAELVRRGLAPSRERAQADISAGRVIVGGAPATKASRLVDAGEAVRILGPPPRFVSRAGAKLEGAITEFGLAPMFEGARVLDAGASTGGFTECSLLYGAETVLAVDVGHNQLHEKLRADARVRNIERTNLRTLDPAILGGPADIVVADLSFISLRLVLAPIFAACRPGALMALLVKPQFEAGKAEGEAAVSGGVMGRAVTAEAARAAEKAVALEEEVMAVAKVAAVMAGVVAAAMVVGMVVVGKEEVMAMGVVEVGWGGHAESEGTGSRQTDN